MSVSYYIIPIEENMYEQLSEFLAQFGIEIPVEMISRYPTPSEIRQVLSEMPAYTKEYFITEKAWQVSVHEIDGYDPKLHLWRGKYASISPIGPAPDELLPICVTFKGSYELNVDILLRLTHFTGPLLLIGDSDMIPLLVSPNDNVADLLREWEKLRAQAHLSQNNDERNDTTQSR